jgi:hypothetical protein
MASETGGGFLMSKCKSDQPAADLSDVTSAGVPWSELPDYALAYVEWMDGRHGSAKEILPGFLEVTRWQTRLR